MLKPKGNLKEKISAAMDRMKQGKTNRGIGEVIEEKTNKKMKDTMSQGIKKYKGGMKNY